MKNITGTLIIKSVESRSFTGYISVENVDLEGDLLLIDAIDKGMPPFLESGGQMQLVHTNIPVGKITTHFVTQDPETGKPAIAFFGTIFNDGRSIHDSVWEEMCTNPAEVGFSIGARPLSEKSEYRNGKKIRVIDKLEVYEVSVIADVGMTKTPPVPANSGAVLLGLGHNPQYLNVPIPIEVKMVLNNMPDDETTETPTEPKEDTTTVDSDPSGPNEEEIRKRLEGELASAVGGKEAITALQKSNQTIAVLTKQLNEANRKNEDLAREQNRFEEDKRALMNKSMEMKIERDFWKEAATSSDNTNQFLNKMLNEGSATINNGGMPTMKKQVDTNNVATQHAKKTIDTVEKFLGNEIALDDDQEFLKTIRGLERMSGGM